MTLKQDCELAALIWTCANDRHGRAQALVDRIYAQSRASGRVPDEATCQKAEQALAWAEDWLMDASISYREAMARYDWLHTPGFAMLVEQLGTQNDGRVRLMRERLEAYDNGTSAKKPEGCYTIEALGPCGNTMPIQSLPGCITACPKHDN